jgi:hypothetical protein
LIVVPGTRRGSPAEDHVVDLRRVDTRTLDRMGDHVSGERRPVRLVERAAKRAADRRARRRDDRGLTHG